VIVSQASIYLVNNGNAPYYHSEEELYFANPLQSGDNCICEDFLFCENNLWEGYHQLFHAPVIALFFLHNISITKSSKHFNCTSSSEGLSITLMEYGSSLMIFNRTCSIKLREYERKIEFIDNVNQGYIYIHKSNSACSCVNLDSTHIVPR
jgi:hypothetical protein